MGTNSRSEPRGRLEVDAGVVDKPALAGLGRTAFDAFVSVCGTNASNARSTEANAS
jgi:hypothetical protein